MRLSATTKFQNFATDQNNFEKTPIFDNYPNWLRQSILLQGVYTQVCSVYILVGGYSPAPKINNEKFANKVTFKLPLKNESTGSYSYENHFENFLLEQPKKVQDKIFKIIEAIETLERVPSNYLKSMEGTNGLYEARIQLGSNIWRVFCFFDNGKLVILLNGFQKKTQKTPKNEI